MKTATAEELDLTGEEAGKALGSSEEKLDAEAAEYESADYETGLAEAVKRGLADINEGRYIESIDEAFSRAAALRQQALRGNPV